MTKVVNVSSPEMLHCGKADGLHKSEGRTTEIVKGEMRLFPRGLRQRYDIKRNHWELGRTLPIYPTARIGIRNESKRQGLGCIGRVDGSVRSSMETGNDRGAKGQIPVRNVAGKQGQPLRGSK